MQRMSFATTADELIAEVFRLWPTNATELGNHEHDDRWPDLTDAGHAERLAFLQDAETRLGILDASSLTRDEAIDLRILREELAAMRFAEETLQEYRWSPLAYVYLFGGGLFSLLAREFAPLPDRLRSAAGRLRGLPEALEAARATLAEPGPRGISTFHAEKALSQLGGVAQLADSAVAEAAKLSDVALRDEVSAAADAAKQALGAWETWLRDELLPSASGDFRLGAELYAAKFGHMLKSSLTPDELAARARADFAAVRDEMLRLARDLWRAWMGDESMPDDRDVLVRRVLDAIAAEHPAADELLDFCRAEHGRIEAFVRERDLIGLADEPMEIIWTPEFLRAFGGAMLMPPGPLDKGLSSFFAITPMPDDWTDEQKESYLREDNSRMLRLLTIHEAVPGHYLQLAYSNRVRSLVRAIFQSGVFAEGWAVYITQVMMDIGYGADDPALMLVHWKFYLRAITNTMMDIEIHAGDMTREAAMDLMVRQGFQEESEAANKWDRARLSSTQLCEYFLGSVEMHALEAEARRRAQEAGTEFVYRPYLERLLSHGTPAMPIIRDLLFGR
jgi:uncharacterized protein (DUF885 family)